MPAINFEGVATQFERIHDEDLIMQIANFFKICDTFKTNKALDNVIRLGLFQFSFKVGAKPWLVSLLFEIND